MCDLRDIAEVKELSGAEQVNELLRGGVWKLLGVACGKEPDGYPLPVYVLGRTREAPEPEWV